MTFETTRQEDEIARDVLRRAAFALALPPKPFAEPRDHDLPQAALIEDTVTLIQELIRGQPRNYACALHDHPALSKCMRTAELLDQRLSRSTFDDVEFWISLAIRLNQDRSVVTILLDLAARAAHGCQPCIANVVETLFRTRQRLRGPL